MSVPKGKRNKSKVEFDDLFFKIANNAADIIENHFGVKDEDYQKHQMWVDSEAKAVLNSINDILCYIRMANVYPTCMAEYETRRDCMSRAIGLSYSILTNYQLVMQRFDIDDDKYIPEIENIWHFINSIKNWRSSDNSRFKKKFEEEYTVNCIHNKNRYKNRDNKSDTDTKEGKVTKLVENANQKSSGESKISKSIHTTNQSHKQSLPSEIDLQILPIPN